MTIFFRGEINKNKVNPQIIHYSSKLYCAVACGAVGWGGVSRANLMGIKKGAIQPQELISVSGFVLSLNFQIWTVSENKEELAL